MNILFFDTETADLPNFKLGAHHTQPSILQLAYCVYSTDLKQTVHTHATIVKPDIPYLINPAAEAVHKISRDVVEAYGTASNIVYSDFLEHLSRCSIVVAHNINFDKMMLDTLTLHLDLDPISWPRLHCTMLQLTGVVPVYNKFGKPKWPKLSEAYEHFFKRPLANAHDALVDVKACQKLYLHTNQH